MLGEWMQIWWVWTVAAMLSAVAEVALGTHLYLLAIAIACAMVAGGLGSGLLLYPDMAGWQLTISTWCVTALACAWALARFRDRIARNTPDPNTPLGRTKAVAGYENHRRMEDNEGDAPQG